MNALLVQVGTFPGKRLLDGFANKCLVMVKHEPNKINSPALAVTVIGNWEYLFIAFQFNTQ